MQNSFICLWVHFLEAQSLCLHRIQMMMLKIQQIRMPISHKCSFDGVTWGQSVTFGLYNTVTFWKAKHFFCYLKYERPSNFAKCLKTFFFLRLCIWSTTSLKRKQQLAGCLPARITGDGWRARPVFVPFIHSFITPSNIYSPTALFHKFKHTQSTHSVLAHWCYRAERKGSLHGASCLGFHCCAPVRPPALAESSQRDNTNHMHICSLGPANLPTAPPATHQPPQHNKWAEFLISLHVSTESILRGGRKGLDYMTKRA